MAEIDRSKLGPDELFLSGRLQVDTALAALAMTGMNPQAETTLRVISDVYSRVTSSEAQGGLSVYLRGEAAAAMRADIAASALLFAEQDQALPDEQRIAAGGLAVILGIGK